MDLYTLVKIAKILKIPESAARYYRDGYSSHIPGIGKGRRRRYKKEAIETLRLIRELADRNLTSEEIEAELNKEYGNTIEAEEENAIVTTA
jgi:DNA-binding transcriptional MerR regulator